MCASKLTFTYVVLWEKMTSKCYLPKKNMWYDWKLFKVLMLRLFSKQPNSRTIVKTQLSCYKDKKKICLSLLVFLLLSFNLCCCVFVPFQCGLKNMFDEELWIVCDLGKASQWYFFSGISHILTEVFYQILTLEWTPLLHYRTTKKVMRVAGLCGDVQGVGEDFTTAVIQWAMACLL